jgi:hypothetical protein
MNDDEKAQDIARKIEREKALLNAAQAMRQQTNNEAVRSKIDTQLRDGRRNLAFFEEKLNELRMRKLGHSMDNMSMGGSTLRDDADGPPTPPPKDASGGYGEYGHGGYGQDGSAYPGHGDSGMTKPRPNFSKLGTP